MVDPKKFALSLFGAAKVWAKMTGEELTPTKTAVDQVEFMLDLIYDYAGSEETIDQQDYDFKEAVWEEFVRLSRTEFGEPDFEGEFRRKWTKVVTTYGLFDNTDV